MLVAIPETKETLIDLNRQAISHNQILITYLAQSIYSLDEKKKKQLS